MERMDDDRTLLTAYVLDGSEEALRPSPSLPPIWSIPPHCANSTSRPGPRRYPGRLLLLARKAISPRHILAAGFIAPRDSFPWKRSVQKNAATPGGKAWPTHLTTNLPLKKSAARFAPSRRRYGAHSRIRRNAILLPLLRRSDPPPTAATLDLSEEAAKKKVSRALEKLRVVLGRKGINSTSSLLGTAHYASAVQPSRPPCAVINLPQRSRLPQQFS